MANTDYSKMLQDFSLQCKHYYRLLDYIEEYEAQHPGISSDEEIVIDVSAGSRSEIYRLSLSADTLAYELARKQVSFIDHVFSQIRKFYGDKIHDILWDYYVLNTSGKSICEKYRFSSCRTMQRRISAWLHDIFGNCKTLNINENFI